MSVAINEILLYNCNVNSYLYLAVSNFVTKLHCKSNKLKQKQCITLHVLHKLFQFQEKKLKAKFELFQFIPSVKPSAMAYNATSY